MNLPPLRRFLRQTHLWILLLPIALIFLGAASNQLVLIANHDTFPVMVNPVHILSFVDVIPPDGMLDRVHCIMTAHTHLNLLADIFDLGSIQSVGDILLEFGSFLWSFAPYVWGFTVLKDLVS